MQGARLERMVVMAKAGKGTLHDFPYLMEDCVLGSADGIPISNDDVFNAVDRLVIPSEQLRHFADSLALYEERLKQRKLL